MAHPWRQKLVSEALFADKYFFAPGTRTGGNFGMEFKHADILFGKIHNSAVLTHYRSTRCQRYNCTAAAFSIGIRRKFPPLSS